MSKSGILLLKEYQVRPQQEMREKGQTLVEVVVALGVAILVITALVAATTTAVRNAQFAKNQSLATKYAQEGMEKARTLRDQNPTSFWNKSGSESEAIGIFTRVTTYNELENDKKMEVKVTVSWTEGSRTHKSEQVSYLTKWQP